MLRVCNPQERRLDRAGTTGLGRTARATARPVRPSRGYTRLSTSAPDSRRALMAETALLDEFEYYLDHQAELAAKYQGRYIVIKGHRLLGEYPTVDEAVRSTIPAHEAATFLVQRCDADPGSTKATCRSRVRFA